MKRIEDVIWERLHMTSARFWQILPPPPLVDYVYPARASPLVELNIIIKFNNGTRHRSKLPPRIVVQ